MASSWNAEIKGPGSVPTAHIPVAKVARESTAASPAPPLAAEPRERVDLLSTPPPEPEEPSWQAVADSEPAPAPAPARKAVPPPQVETGGWALAPEGLPEEVGAADVAATARLVPPLAATSDLVATASGSLQILDAPSAGAAAASWNEEAIRGFTSRGIPIRDFRSRAEQPEWQVDTRSLRAFLETDAARCTAASQDFPIDYRGEGVPQADCVLTGPGAGGGCVAQLSFADGRSIRIVSDGPLKREHITNVARTVGESNPRMFRSRYPGQGDTTVLVADHLGQFTSRGRIVDVGGLGGNGPTITMDRMMLDSESIGSLTHEWMHSFDHAASVVSRQARASDGRPLFGPEGGSQATDFVTSYARTNPLEDFAESGEWVNDVLVHAHRSGTDLVRAGGEAFRRYLVENWGDVKPDTSSTPAPRLLEKASFIYKTLDLAPDTPMRFTLADGALPVDADRTAEFRRDVQVLAANHPGVRSADVEIGADARSYRLLITTPQGSATTATVKVPYGAQTDLATVAPLLAYGDVQARAPQDVYVPTVEFLPREGSGLVAGRPTTVLGADLYMEGEGGPSARLDRVLHYGVQHGTARDLLIHIGVDDLDEVTPPLRQLLASGHPDVDRVTLVDCQGKVRTLEATDEGGARLPIPREAPSAPLGELPPEIRAANAAREAAENARLAALAPRQASSHEVETVTAKVNALVERVARLGNTPEAAEASEMLGMLSEMLAAPSLTEEELGSIVAEVMQWSSRLEGPPAFPSSAH